MQRITRSLIVMVLLAGACGDDTTGDDGSVVATTAGTPTTVAVTLPPSTTTTEVPMPSSPTSLVPSDANPVLARPVPAGVAMLPTVIELDGMMHMWFTLSDDPFSVPTAIFHAVSEDGLSWIVDESPALTGDGTGFDAFQVAEPVVFPTLPGGEGLVMLYNARSAPGPGPGDAIGMATAPGPAGPWTAATDPVLVVGGSDEWDAGFVSPASVVIGPDQATLHLYYSGGTDYLSFSPFATGLAISEDGIAWTKHPEPVLAPQGSGWDGQFSWEAAVFPHDGGFGALYTGDPTTLTGEAIGFAWSADGISWIRYPNNPLLKPRDQEWASLDVVAGSVVVAPDGRILLFYSGNTGTAGPLDFSIGVAEVVFGD